MFFYLSVIFRDKKIPPGYQWLVSDLPDHLLPDGFGNVEMLVQLLAFYVTTPTPSALTFPSSPMEKPGEAVTSSQ